MGESSSQPLHTLHRHLVPRPWASWVALRDNGITVDGALGSTASFKTWE